MRWRVQKRDQNDKSRFDEFFAYQGPDLGTLQLLKKHHEEWLICPIKFWTDWSPESRDPLITDPGAHAVECYMRLKKCDGL